MWKIVPPFAMEVIASQSCAAVDVAGRHPAAPLLTARRSRHRRIAVEQEHARAHLRAHLGQARAQVEPVQGGQARVDDRDVGRRLHDRVQRSCPVVLRADDQ